MCPSKGLEAEKDEDDRIGKIFKKGNLIRGD